RDRLFEAQLESKRDFRPQIDLLLDRLHPRGQPVELAELPLQDQPLVMIEGHDDAKHSVKAGHGATAARAASWVGNTGINASVPATCSTLATLPPGQRMASLPPLLFTVLAPTRSTRIPYDDKKLTPERSTTIERFSCASALNGISIRIAPVVSKRPRRMTFVPPSPTSSTAMSSDAISTLFSSAGTRLTALQ